jgi:L-threonylcarbamoyladenylate synthase
VSPAGQAKIVDAQSEEAKGELERTIGSGGVVVFPADGLYGLACDPLNPAAVVRIHQLKGRDDRKSSAVMYFSPLALRELVAGLGTRAAAVVSALLPGPVTLIVDNPEERYPLACREDRSRLGIRLIGGPLAGAMCPIFQTSANVSGEPAPARFGEVPDSILAGVDLAIDGGKLGGLPSTVIDVSAIDRGDGWEVLRQGALSEGDLVSALASVGLD